MNTIDLANLTPAPWISAPFKSDGSGGTWLDIADAHFIAIARNAFDVMMRRGWSVKCFQSGRWYVDNGSEYLNSADDPFTALLEADAWYKANVEAETP